MIREQLVAPEHVDDKLGSLRSAWTLKRNEGQVTARAAADGLSGADDARRRHPSRRCRRTEEACRAAPRATEENRFAGTISLRGCVVWLKLLEFSRTRTRIPQMASSGCCSPRTRVQVSTVRSNRCLATSARVRSRCSGGALPRTPEPGCDLAVEELHFDPSSPFAIHRIK